MSDGKIAIVDKRDALHIANGAADKKTSEIAKIKNVIENAKLCAEDAAPMHNKFDYFCYYKTYIKYNEKISPLYLNVGRGINDKKYHIYDITQNVKDTVNRINGLERPKPNEGYAIQNDVFDNSIPDSEQKSNSFSENSSESSGSEALLRNRAGLNSTDANAKTRCLR